MGFMSSGEQARAEAKASESIRQQAIQQTGGFSGTVKESGGGQPSSQSTYVNSQLVQKDNTSYVAPGQVATLQYPNQTVQITSSSMSTQAKNNPQSFTNGPGLDNNNIPASLMAQFQAEANRRYPIPPQSTFMQAVKQYLEMPTRVVPFGIAGYGSGVTVSDVLNDLEKQNPKAVYPNAFLRQVVPTTLGGSLAMGLGAIAFSLLPEVAILPVSAGFTGIGLAQRQLATTPEERAAAEINIGMSLLPFATKGFNYAFREPVNIPIKDGQMVRLPALDEQGRVIKTPEGRIVYNEVPYSARENIKFQAETTPKQIGDNMFSLGRVKIYQLIPESFKTTFPNRISSVLFGGTDETLAAPKFTEVISRDPIVIDNNGNIVGVMRNGQLINENPIFSAGKPGSSFKNYAELSANSQQVPLSQFKTFSPELKAQVLADYEARTGRLVSEDMFTDMYKNSNVKYSVSNIEAQKIYRITEKGKLTSPLNSFELYSDTNSKYDIFSIRANNYEQTVRINKALGRTISRSQMFDASKLIFSNGQADVYGVTTSFRDVTMPEDILGRGGPRTVRNMEGVTRVNKPQEPVNNFYDDVLTKSEQTTKQVQKINTQKTANTINKATASVVDVLLPQKKAVTYIRPTKTVPTGILPSVLIGATLSTLPRVRAQSKQNTNAANDVLTGQRSSNALSSASATRLSTASAQIPDVLTRTLTRQAQQPAQQTRQLQQTRQITRQVTIQIPAFDTPSIPTPTFSMTPPSPPPTRTDTGGIFWPGSQPKRRKVIPQRPQPRSKGRGYEMTGTLLNVVSGRRRAKPIPLSRLTGFEALTL